MLQTLGHVILEEVARSGGRFASIQQRQNSFRLGHQLGLVFQFTEELSDLVQQKLSGTVVITFFLLVQLLLCETFFLFRFNFFQESFLCKAMISMSFLLNTRTTPPTTIHLQQRHYQNIKYIVRTPAPPSTASTSTVTYRSGRICNLQLVIRPLYFLQSLRYAFVDLFHLTPPGEFRTRNRLGPRTGCFFLLFFARDVLQSGIEHMNI